MTTVPSIAADTKFDPSGQLVDEGLAHRLSEPVHQLANPRKALVGSERWWPANQPI